MIPPPTSALYHFGINVTEDKLQTEFNFDLVSVDSSVLMMFVKFFDRTLVLPYDLGRFDAMVSAHEKEALEYLSGFVPGMNVQFNVMQSIQN